MARPQITCLMCGLRGPSAREDVIPKWLAKLLALESTGQPPYFNRELETAEHGFALKSERHIGGPQRGAAGASTGLARPYHAHKSSSRYGPSARKASGYLTDAIQSPDPNPTPGTSPCRV